MGNNQNDFVLDAKGHCFLCLDKISTVKYEQGQGSEPRPFPKYSLYYLSRYLKMDMRKVFKDMEQIPSHLLAKVENSRLKVELCDECVRLTELFSENYRKLEKAEIELGSCLRLIHAKFQDGSGPGMTQELKKLTNLEPHLSNEGELEILEVLREEAFQKSHLKLRAVVPRVKFRKLTKKEIRAKQLKFKAVINIAREQQKHSILESNMDGYSMSDMKASGSEIKLETRDFLSESVDNIDSDNIPSDDFNADTEPTCEDFDDTTLKMGDNGTYYAGAGSSEVTRRHWTSNAKPGAKLPVFNINPETGKYKCGTCAMEFSHQSGLKFHCESVHLNIRFKCVSCGKQFTQRSACNRHQKTVHGGVRYASQVCSKSFKHTFEVRNHQRGTECGSKLGILVN